MHTIDYWNYRWTSRMCQMTNVWPHNNLTSKKSELQKHCRAGCGWLLLKDCFILDCFFLCIFFGLISGMWFVYRVMFYCQVEGARIFELPHPVQVISFVCLFRGILREEKKWDWFLFDSRLISNWWLIYQFTNEKLAASGARRAEKANKRCALPPNGWNGNGQSHH